MAFPKGPIKKKILRCPKCGKETTETLCPVCWDKGRYMPTREIKK